MSVSAPLQPFGAAGVVFTSGGMVLQQGGQGGLLDGAVEQQGVMMGGAPMMLQLPGVYAAGQGGVMTPMASGPMLTGAVAGAGAGGLRGGGGVAYWQAAPGAGAMAGMPVAMGSGGILVAGYPQQMQLGEFIHQQGLQQQAPGAAQQLLLPLQQQQQAAFVPFQQQQQQQAMQQQPQSQP